MKKTYTYLTLFLALTINAQDANLDLTFGINGFVTHQNIGIPNAIAFQSDGKLLVYGYKMVSGSSVPMLFRLNIDGSLDAAFGNSGIKTFDAYLNNQIGNLIVQSDGNLLITIGSYLYRLNSNGIIDATFNDNTGNFNYANFVKELTNGKLIVFYENNQEMHMRRLNANGTEDLTFNNGNYQDIYAGPRTKCVGVNELTNGKIVISATSQFGGFKTQRFNANGTTDLTYSTTGIANGGNPKDSKSVGDNVFLTMEYGFTSAFSAVKYNNLGNLDTNFNSTGAATTGFETNEINISYNINLQSDNKIIVVGKTGGFTTSSFGIIRFNSDGSLDTSFGTLGKTTIPANTLTDVKTLSAISPIDQKLTVVGQVNTIPSNAYDVVVIRHNTGANLYSNEVNPISKIKLFPNPTANALKIQSNDTINSIAIIDTFGRTHSVPDFSGETINVSHLPKGIYFIEIQTAKGRSVEKFIKN